jgi:hypothetical protein
LRFWEPRGPRKRRTREHVIADLSVNYVERFVLRCGWTIQRSTPDYGVDFAMKTYNSVGEQDSGRVLFQLKATDKLKLRDQGRAVAIRLDLRDVRGWRAEPMPVILILYDAHEDQAYWLHLQPYFMRPRRRQGATTTVYLPCEQVVNEAAIRRFAVLRDEVLARIQRVIFDEE